MFIIQIDKVENYPNEQYEWLLFGIYAKKRVCMKIEHLLNRSGVL